MTVPVMRSKGTPIPTNDIWIAALTKEARGELVARDGHFDALPMLALAKELSA